MTPNGRAPVIDTFRVASATLIAAPRYGSSAATPWTQSVEATRPSGVPFTRRTALPPRAGPATVLVCTVLSYCSVTQRRSAMFGEPSSPSRTRPGSIPRSGRSWPGSAGSPGAGAARRRAGGLAARRWTIASLVRARAGIRASSTGPQVASRSPAPSSSALVTIVTSPSSVTVPMTAHGRPQRSHTARTSPTRSGRTIASIRSWLSEIITS